MSEEKMCAISLDQFSEQQCFEVDVFIQINNSKFILFGRAGQILDPEHLNKYKQKNIQYLFVRASDFGKLVHHAVSFAGIAINQKNITFSAKIKALENACISMFAEIKALGFDERSFSHANIVTQATINLVASYPNLASMVEKLISNSARDERHALMVSAIAGMMGVSMGWTRSATLERLSLGGLLHDIGKLNLPDDIMARPFESLKPDEQTIYKSHCEFGRQTLAKLRVIPDDVRLMVFEHHECADGSGYPRGAKDLLISPYGRVLILANAFTEMVLGFGGTFISKNNIKKSLEIIENEQSEKFNRDCIKALNKVVGREWKTGAA